MRIHRFHSPLQHWFRGLITEVAALTSFVAALFLVIWLVMWVR